MKIILIITSLVLASLPVTQQEACGCTPMSKRSALLGEDMKLELRSRDGSERLVDGDQVFVSKDRALFGGFRASISDNYKWPQGTIYYKFDGLSGGDQQSVRNALQQLTYKTGGCVKFREIQSPRREGYARVFPGGGCYSYIGNLKREQDISIGRGCTGPETVQHEFMHALGFYHEQSRPDRDAYVKVNWGNIGSSKCGNFEKCRGCKTTTKYDIKSVMQYQGNAFSCDRNRPTMEDKKDPNNPIVRNRELRPSDIQKIRDYYLCF